MTKQIHPKDVPYLALCQVRMASSADARALSALRWNWVIDEDGASGPDRSKFDRAFAEWMRENAHTHIPFLAEVDSEPVGMAWLAIVERVPKPTAFERVEGDLQSVYILPDFRNRGIGQIVISAVISEARARKIDRISVRASKRSYIFYQRLGFTESEGVFRLSGF